jgi:hypothetical protein
MTPAIPALPLTRREGAPINQLSVDLRVAAKDALAATDFDAMLV